MRKQKIIVSMAIVLCICLITSIFILVQAGIGQTEISEDTFQNSISQQLSGEIIAKDMVSVMRSHGYYTDEIRRGITQYANILIKYHLSAEETTYIMEQVNSGRDLSKICELYYFIKNTSLNYSDIGPMYAIGEQNEFSGDYWAENAFDTYTNNENTLDKTEILAFLDETIGLEDVQLANILSRRGVKTIREIIGDMKNGTEISEIIAQIYPEISFSPECFGNITDGFVLLEGIDIAQILKCDINSVIEDGKIKEASRNEVAALLDAVYQFIQENGFEERVDDIVLNEAKQELPHIEKDAIEKKLNAGMSVREVIALFREE